MNSHVSAASARVPTGCAQIGGTALDPENIAVGVTGQRITRASVSHFPDDTGLIEGAGAASNSRPDLDVAKPFAASVGATRDVRRGDHTGRLAGYGSSNRVVWRYCFHCHVARRQGRPVLRQAAIARTTSGQKKKG
jgi:hypothetical protein